MILSGDFHVHTSIRPADDGALDMKPCAIANFMKSAGCSCFGVSPHVHAGVDVEALINQIKLFAREAGKILPCLCGVETECLDCSGLLTIDRTAAASLDYIIAAPDHYNCNGVVKPPRKREAMLEFHHQQLLMLAEHPLVDVIAHPWAALILLTCEGHLGECEHITALDDIPESWFHELASVAVKNNTAIEMNGFFTDTYLRRREAVQAGYKSKYFRFFEIMAEAGVKLSPASDAHSIADLEQYLKAWSWIEALGVPQEQVWVPAKLKL